MASNSGSVTVGNVNKCNWEEILRKNYMVLSRIKVDLMTDTLFQEHILNEDDKDEIRSLRTRRAKATFLLDLLSTKGYDSFVTFLNMLENEYPEFYQTVTGKAAVRKPGYRPRDRSSFFLEQMPEVLSRLQEEMKHSKYLADSLDHVQKSIEFLNQEKADLETELETYRVELLDQPQLKRDIHILAQENEKLRYENHDLTRQVLVGKNEKENIERKYRELQSDIRNLQSEVETVKFERDKEKRKTQRLVKLQQQSVDSDFIPDVACDDYKENSVRSQLEQEVTILKSVGKELQDQNDELGELLTKTRMDLHHVEENCRKALVERDKSQEALRSAEENRDNLMRRCEDTWQQVDQLRQEKDKAMESHQYFMNLYNVVSIERDRLSTQLRKMGNQYDVTKKQLDKLRQDMRSSLKSSNDSLDFSTVNQWIRTLEAQRLFGSGTSSSEMSEPSTPSPVAALPNPNHNITMNNNATLISRGYNTLPVSFDTVTDDTQKRPKRTNTLEPVAGDDPEDVCDDPGDDVREVLTRRRRLISGYDPVSVGPGAAGKRCVNLNLKSSSNPSTKPVLNNIPDEVTSRDLYIRCVQEYNAVNDEELSYTLGDILQVAISCFQERKEVWYAQKVDLDTGVPIAKGTIKAAPLREDRSLEKRPQGSSLGRRDAVKQKFNGNTGPYTFVTMEKVTHLRPVLYCGQRRLTEAISTLLTKDRKYESWFSESIKDLEKKICSLSQQDNHTILPPGSFQLCHNAKVYPICIHITTEDDGQSNQHLNALFGDVGTDIANDNKDTCKELEEMKAAAANCKTFTISKKLTPTVEELVKRMVDMVDSIQRGIVWVPSLKQGTLSPCSSP